MNYFERKRLMRAGWQEAYGDKPEAAPVAADPRQASLIDVLEPRVHVDADLLAKLGFEQADE